MKTAIREWTREMLEASIICRSKSPYSAPTFCVNKAVGWRIVHDFRGINAKIRLPATPVPRKEDIFDAMRNGKMFSSMNLLWGFFQVSLREQDIPYTAFSTPDGLFALLVTPMGLSCSPAAFNRLIQNVFADQKSFCQAYFDDLFVFTPSDDVDGHLAALEKVLERCKNEQLYVKLSKCTFCARDTMPRRLYRRRRHSHGSRQALAAPLTELAKGKSRNETLEFNEEQRTCFDELKRRLSNPPVLAHPDFTKTFCVKMDASDYA
ncbi:hypothetical protein PC110_g23169, partial [Phytophthora cactorum]